MERTMGKKKSCHFYTTPNAKVSKGYVGPYNDYFGAIDHRQKCLLIELEQIFLISYNLNNEIIIAKQKYFTSF